MAQDCKPGSSHWRDLTKLHVLCKRCERPTKAEFCSQHCEWRYRETGGKQTKIYSRKLNPDQVLEICERADAEEPRQQIAKDYGISQAMVRKIDRGHAWRSVTKRPKLPLATGHSCGQKVWRAKLTANQVREIRAMADAGEKIEFLAAMYGVSSANVYYIIHRMTWKHI